MEVQNSEGVYVLNEGLLNGRAAENLALLNFLRSTTAFLESRPKICHRFLPQQFQTQHLMHLVAKSVLMLTSTNRKCASEQTKAEKKIN